MRKLRLRLPMAAAYQIVKEKEEYIKMLKEMGHTTILDIVYEPSVVHSVLFCFDEEENGDIPEEVNPDFLDLCSRFPFIGMNC